MKVGVDAYISKMRPEEFSKTLNGLIGKSSKTARSSGALDKLAQQS